LFRLGSGLARTGPGCGLGRQAVADLDLVEEEGLGRLGRVLLGCGSRGGRVLGVGRGHVDILVVGLCHK